MSVVSMVFDAGIARLRIFDICFTAFCVTFANESEGTVGFGSARRAIMYPIY